MSEMRRCDCCGQVTDYWFKVTIDRMAAGINVNQMGDSRERDVCPACADTLLTPLGVKP